MSRSKNTNKGFAITSHKGFQLKFDNGWSVSVQFGVGNYCEHHGDGEYEAPEKSDFWTSSTAEVAAWDKDGEWYEFEDDCVKGYLSVAEVLEFINMIAAKEVSA